MRRTLVVALLALLGAGGAQAQGTAAPHAAPRRPATPEEAAAAPEVPALPDGTRRVEGQVVLPRDSGFAPVADRWVTLHRVGRDTAGALDSVRTDAAGRYTLRYRPSGDANALYFAATMYGGIAYFTPPLRDALSRGDAAEITVFDTTSRPIPITVRGRHVIVAAPDASGARNVIEVFEISNDTSVTAVPAQGSARGTWSVPLPTGARQFAVRPGEVPADGMTATNGRAVLLVPVGPGIKQVAFSYALPASAFPLALVAERATSVLEVLLEDPRGTAAAPNIRPSAAVTVEGRSFRRYLAQDVPAGARIAIDVPAPRASWERWGIPALVAVSGLAMFAVFARALRRGRPAPVPVPASRASGAGDDRERLLAALVALDADFAAREAPSDADRAAYETERSALKARLAALLAGAGAAG